MKSFKSVDEILLYYLEKIITQGEESSPREKSTKEILGASFRLENIKARLINITARKWSFKLATGEFLWHFNGSDDSGFISHYAPVWNTFSNEKGKIPGSCYGKKLFKGGQWENLIELFEKDIDTRRAVVSFYDRLNKDNISGVDIACITNVQFLVRDNKLNCITSMRSNDIIWGLGYDIFIITLFQEILANELNVEVGWYQHNANSLHLYERHFELANSILLEGLPNKIKTMSPINSYIELELLSAFEKQYRTESSLNYGIMEELTGGAKMMAESLIEDSEKVFA